MRMIGSLDSAAAASRFADYLFVQGIENSVDEEDDGTFSIWIHEDENIPRASELLATFRADPNAREFDAASHASSKRRDLEKAEERRRSVVADSARVSYERTFMGMAYLPATLIIISIAVFIVTDLGAPRGWYKTPWLMISEYIRMGESFYVSLIDASRPFKTEFLSEIRSGQVWRLITPIFLHGSFLHIIFNMMWLRDLGSLFETRFGFRYLAGFILVAAVLSNLAQAAWGSPLFGGMSGVNYALFGFLWMRGKYDRFSTWELHPHIVYTLIAWFFVCFTGLVGNVANTTHAVGLVVGAAWGYATSGRLRFGK